MWLRVSEVEEERGIGIFCDKFYGSFGEFFCIVGLIFFGANNFVILIDWEFGVFSEFERATWPHVVGVGVAVILIEALCSG